MRNKKIASYLTVAVMGVGLLLPGNSALAKEEDKNAEAEIVQETIESVT